MANLNKVMLIGNLTRDPELRFLPSGTPVCEMGLAVNRTWTDQQGERKEQVCFVDLTAFGRQAETLGQYMRKGRPLFVEGRLDYQSWDGPDGAKRSKLKVVVENFQFLGSRSDGPAAGPGGPREGAGEQAPTYSASRTASSGPAVDEDDIPF